MTTVKALAALVRGHSEPDVYASAREFYLGLPQPDPAADTEARSRQVYTNLRAAVRRDKDAGLLGLDIGALTTQLTWAAVTDPSLFIATLLHHGMAHGSVLELSGADAESATTALATCTSIGVFAVTELGSAGGHVALQTVATFDPDNRDFVLHTPHAGARKIMANAGDAAPKIAVTYADLVVNGESVGVFAFTVDVSNAAGPLTGVQVSPIHTPLLPLDYAIIRFDSVRVPYGSWLADGATIDQEGVFRDVARTPAERLTRSYRILGNSWPSFLVGVSAATRAGVTVAISAAQVRKASGAQQRYLIDLISQQRTLLSALATAYALTSLANRAVGERTAVGLSAPTIAGERRGLTPWTAVNRAHSSWKAIAADRAAATLADCRLSMGVQGTLTANRVVAYEGLARACHAAGGDNTLTFVDVGYTLLEEANESSGEGDDRPDIIDLGEPNCLLALLHRRVRHLRGEIHASSARHPGEDRATFKDRYFHELRDLGEAVAVTDVMAAMIDDMRKLDGHVRPVYGWIACLFGLQEINRHLHSFVTFEILTRCQIAGVARMIESLCVRLRPHIVDLVDAFEIPFEIADF